MPRNDERWAKIRELVGDVGTPGTLRRQAADLSTEMGDHGVLMAIDRATEGAWMPPAVRYKYQHFFTHWAVLAIMRLGDRDRESLSIPALTCLLRTLHQEGGMTRDSWIEGMGGIREWRQAKEIEERERFERLSAQGGGPAWVDIGPGGKSAALNEVWNRLTGRDRGNDGGDEDMEDYVLDRAVRSLDHPSVKKVRTWRNKYVAHRDARRMRSGLAGYEVFPIKPVVRAYWAVMMAAHRVLLLADASGLHGLYPMPQFSIAKAMSGGRLDRDQTDIVEERLMAHSLRWERLLQRSEEGWYRELKALREAGWPRAVTHPRLPRFRACPIRAPGSSDDGLAAQRYTLCTTRAAGRG